MSDQPTQSQSLHLILYMFPKEACFSILSFDSFSMFELVRKGSWAILMLIPRRTFATLGESFSVGDDNQDVMISLIYFLLSTQLVTITNKIRRVDFSG